MPFIRKSPLNSPINTSDAFRLWEDTRAPTATDFKSFAVSDHWWDKTAREMYVCCYRSSSEGTWRRLAGVAGSIDSLIPDGGISPVVSNAANEVTFAGGAGITTVGGLNTLTFDLDFVIGPMVDGDLLIGSTGLDPVIAQLTAGAGINILSGAGSITISATGGLAWVESVGAAQAMATNTSYGANRAGGVTFTLPAVSAAGDVIEIVGMQGLWAINQGAGQQVMVGNDSTAIGIGGSLTATDAGDCIRLKCINANVRWRSQATQGNLTIV